MSIEFSEKFREGRLLFVLIPLLVLHLALLSIQIEDPTGTTLFKRWVLQISGPFLNFTSSIPRGAVQLWRNYFQLQGVRQENYRLQEKIRQLSFRENALAQAEAENLRLHKLLSLKEELPYQGIGASVVGRTPNFLAHVLYINRGSVSGVPLNAPVLTENGVIGRTVLVTPRNSQVQLITNADASTGAMVERSRSPGVLTGTGESLLQLSYISNNEPIEVGDLVVTSGLDGVFPKGLPLGRVVESRKGKSVFRVILVAPMADLVRIEEVLLLLSPSSMEPVAVPRPSMPGKTGG